MRHLSAWSIRNPIPSLVLFSALVLAGVLSYVRMNIDSMPVISFPAVQVVVAQPGASPMELETQVTQQIEAAVRGVNGVDEISSTVTEGGSATYVQFDLGTPVDRAMNDVRDVVAAIRLSLPDDILEPRVVREDIDSGPIVFLSIESVDTTPEALSWFVTNTVVRRLTSIDGVAHVERSGGVEQEIRVILDPNRMQAYGITAAQLNNQLRQVHLNVAGGRMEVAGAEQLVRVLANSTSAHALAQTRIALGDGRQIRLVDVANVSDSHAEQRTLAVKDGRQVISLAVEKMAGASDVVVYKALQLELGAITRKYPDIRFSELFTTVRSAEADYRAAMVALLEGALLAVVIVGVFLRDWRATIISAVAIPLSVIPTFWFMDLMGFTLNGISLLALSLVAGVLVDDAIVEIENIMRHMSMGKPAYQAAIDAADEIGLAVVATTAAIVAVFLPVGLMPGLAGQFFEQFGLTVVVAVLMSLAVARLITPLIAAYFLKTRPYSKQPDGKLMKAYMCLLRCSLRHRWKVVGSGGLAIVATILAYATLPTAFQPSTDQDFSTVNIHLPPGATLDQTKLVAMAIATRLDSEPEVQTAFASVNVGDAKLYLTLRPGRKRTSVEFERAMQPILATVPDARIAFQSQEGGSGRDITVMLASNDPAKLHHTAVALVEQMRALAELRAPRIEGEMRRPEIIIRPRMDLATDVGVTTTALSQAIRSATIGEMDRDVAKFVLPDRQIPIRLIMEQSARQKIETFWNLPVPTSSGGSVPLGLVAEVSFASGPTEIRRFNQKRRIVLSADLAPGLVAGSVASKVNELPLLKNLPEEVERIEYGNSKLQSEMVSSFVFAVVSGIILVFLVLVLLYHRIMPAFVNMSSLLLAPLGGAIALHLTGNIVSMPVFIGVLMLLGIVAKNSILFVDFVIEEMTKGVEKSVAIIDAGHKRARPIIMTTAAMVVGMLPTAAALSGDATWRAPMGITVIGGLVMSTLLTLVIVPAAFSLADDFERLLAAKLSWLLPKPTLSEVHTA